MNRHNTTQGFTLIELLVVIAIISLLLSVLLPALNSAKRVARGVLCQSNLRHTALWALMYTAEQGDFLPHNGVKRAGDVANFYSATTNYWHQKNPTMVTAAKGMGIHYSSVGANLVRVIQPTALHCPQMSMSNIPRYSVDDVASTDYCINKTLGGYRRGKPDEVPRATKLNSGTFWFGDGTQDQSSLNVLAKYMVADATTPYMVPWMWQPAYSKLQGHPNQTANFVFGDGHAEPLTAEMAKQRDQKTWLGD